MCFKNALYPIPNAALSHTYYGNTYKYEYIALCGITSPKRAELPWLELNKTEYLK